MTTAPEAMDHERYQAGQARRRRVLPASVKLLSASSDLRQYLGRAEICQQVVALEPVGPLPETGPEQVRKARIEASTWFDLGPHDIPAPGAAGGFSWSLVAPNQLPLAIRVTAHPTEDAARTDLMNFLRHAAQVKLVDVHSPTTGQHGTWLTLNGQVLMVSGRMWRRADASLRNALVKMLRRHSDTRRPPQPR